MNCARSIKVRDLVHFVRFRTPCNSLSTAVEKAIKSSSKFSDSDAVYTQYLSAAEGKSNTHAREIAKEILGQEVFWNWDCMYATQLPDAPP